MHSAERRRFVNPNVAEQALLHVIELEKDTPLAGQAYLALAGIHRKAGKD